MGEKDYNKAISFLFRAGGGTVRLKDGRLFSGSLLDIQQEIDDPEGIGYFTLIDGKQAVDINQNEFVELVDIR